MKITSTFMAIFMGCAVLAFNACDDTGGSKNKTKKLQELLLLYSGSGYAIGDTGPSGVGIVFYTTDCGSHGLEAAPSGWYQVSGDPTADAWIFGTYETTPIGTTGTAIGTGLTNSITIVTDNDNLSGTSAAGLCRAYTGGGKTDWFLPSLDELAQLYSQETVVGGFETIYYWSSSEGNATCAGTVRFDNGIQIYANKVNWVFYVRPVRAF